MKNYSTIVCSNAHVIQFRQRDNTRFKVCSSVVIELFRKETDIDTDDCNDAEFVQLVRFVMDYNR